MDRIEIAMKLALDAARLYRGATSPNPPVGAVALDPFGQVLSVGAHRRAGGAHAEVHAIEGVELPERIHSMVVTLEPCSIASKTPPCTEALLKLPSLKTVFIGALDPNPSVNGRGVQALKDRGVEVDVGVLQEECEKLIAPFKKFVETGRPWITVKTAHLNGSMIPPQGTKTFTSKASLTKAHELRRRADAIITGSGTVLADQPEFTVRHVSDHSDRKKRLLLVFDRRGRIPEKWIRAREDAGFEVAQVSSIDEGLNRLREHGALEVLVEAGPTLSKSLLESELWDEHWKIRAGSPDRIEVKTRLSSTPPEM